MVHYSIEPSDGIFLESYEVLSFAYNIDKNIAKNLSGKYSHKLLDHAK